MMWYFRSVEDESRQFVILPGKDYVIGRRDCDIVIDYDQSVSRKHAVLRVSHSEANVGNVNKPASITLKDVSKYGTFINKQKVAGEQTLHNGDEVRFGTPKSVHRVVYEPFVITASCVDGSGKKEIRSLSYEIGGHVSNDWRKDCSLLVMKSLTVTIKVVCALVSQKPIVTPNYLSDLLKHLKGETAEKPQPENYLPPITEKLNNPSVSFHAAMKRSSVFLGRSFYFLCKKQFQKMNLAIELGGGVPMLCDSPKDADLNEFLEDMVVVMSPALGELHNQEQKQWVNKVESFLHKKNKRMVQDAEIGYAVLHCSTEDYCNPDKDVSHLLSTSTPFQGHTQMDSLASQMTVTDTQNSQLHPQSKNMAVMPASARCMPEPDTSGQTFGEARLKNTKRVVAQSPDRSQKSGQMESFLEEKDQIFTVPESLPEETLKCKKEKHVKNELSQSFAVPESEMFSKISQSEVKREKPMSPTVADPERHPAQSVSLQASEPPHATDNSSLFSVEIKEEVIEESQQMEVPDEEEKDEPIRKPAPSKNKRKLQVSSEEEKENPFDFVQKRPRKSAVPSKPKRKSESENDDSDDNPFDFTTRPKTTGSSSPEKLDKRSERTSRHKASPSPGPPSPRSSSPRRPASRSPSPRHPSPKSKSKTSLSLSRSPQVSSSTKNTSNSTDTTTKETVYNKAVPKGFLSTRTPIEEQVAINPYFEKENIKAPSVVVEFEDLVMRHDRSGAGKNARKNKNEADAPDGMMRWNGKLVKNFKKFRKVKYIGADSLPRIIGGRDLEEHCHSANKMMDEWRKDLQDMESQQHVRDREAEQLFDWQPASRAKKGSRR